MEYKEIVSVTGESGLFQLVSSKSDGAIVRSLDGKTTRFVPSRNHNFTPLESIEVFTTGENVPLLEVFKAMQEKESSIPVIESGKDTETVKQYFERVYPDLDKERVYMSDMKKMLKWYPILKENDLLTFEEEAEEAEEAKAEEVEQKDKPEVQTETTKESKETEPTSKATDKPVDKKEKAPKGSDEKPVEKKAATKSAKPEAAKKKTAAKKSGSEKS